MKESTKRMKKTLLAAAFLLAVFNVKAQQDPQFSQNPFTRMMFNPGYAGANDLLCGTVIHRSQWIGLAGRPTTNLIAFDSPIKLGDKKPIGVGLTIATDQLGFDQQLQAKLAGAYRMTLGDGNLGIGVEFGYMSKTVDAQWLAIDDYTQDPNIPQAGINANTIDIGFGAHYQIPGKMYVGISALHLNAGKFTAQEYIFTMARHYYVIGGYEHPLTDDITIRPNVWMKTDFASTQVDINANVLYKNMIWGGLSYRLQDAIVPTFGYQNTLPNGKGNYRIGYSYDVTTSMLRSYSSGSHEIMVGFCYDIFPKPKITRYRNVRFL